MRRRARYTGGPLADAIVRGHRGTYPRLRDGTGRTVTANELAPHGDRGNFYRLDNWTGVEDDVVGPCLEIQYVWVETCTQCGHTEPPHHTVVDGEIMENWCRGGGDDYACGCSLFSREAWPT